MWPYRCRSLVMGVVMLGISLFTSLFSPSSVVHASATSCTQGTGLITDIFAVIPTPFPFTPSAGDIITVTIRWSDTHLNPTLRISNGVIHIFANGGSPLSKTVTYIGGPFPADFFAEDASGSEGPFSYILDINGGCKGSSAANCVNLDNRLNSICDDGMQTAAAYCEKDGSVTVYAIDNSKGYFAFTVTPEELAKVPAKPAVNTLIKEKLGARLYRLTSGELQLSRAQGNGEDYVFRFDDCAKP